MLTAMAAVKNIKNNINNKIIKKIIKNVKKVKGLFVSLWHNEALGDKKQWDGWRKTYEKMIQYALNGNKPPKTRRNSKRKMG